MNRIRAGVLVALLGLPLSVAVADSDKPDRTGCDSVNWSAEVLAQFPNAKRGCQRVTVRGDDVYVQYKAEVANVHKDSIVAYLKDHDGKNMTKVTLAPAKDEMINVSGEDIKFWNVKKGTELRFYVPHNRWGLFAAPGGAPIRVISTEPM